ncbi:MAG: hypothetical protein KKH94_11330 [Candidatus Omnitrophica bacterium]|nr:hypothetical protein [Candidatus Omnitrophota bacterium]
MGYEAITNEEIIVGKPVTNPLMAKIKGNLDYLLGQIGVNTLSGIIPNASFEIDSDEDGIPDQWTRNLYPGGSGAYEETDIIHGSKAYKFVHPGGDGNGGGYLTSDYIEAAGNTQLNVRFWLKTTNAAIKVQGKILCYDTDKIQLSGGDAEKTFYSSVANPTSWTNIEGSLVTLPVATRYIKVRLLGGVDDTNQTGIVYFDLVAFPIIDLSITEGKIGNAAVSQGKLKTSQGSVSTVSTAGAELTLPGGSYGFYPQVRSAHSSCTVEAKMANGIYFTSYATNIFLKPSTVNGAYAQQRYVTASGKDPWLFILYDKKEGQIVSTWYAPDHPSYGQGGNEKKVPHPFADYLGKELSEHLEIILVDLKQTREIEKEARVEQTVSEIVMAEYTVATSEELKFKKRDVSNEKGEHRFIEEIPDYIKVRKLKR